MLSFFLLSNVLIEASFMNMRPFSSRKVETTALLFSEILKTEPFSRRVWRCFWKKTDIRHKDKQSLLVKLELGNHPCSWGFWSQEGPEG